MNFEFDPLFIQFILDGLSHNLRRGKHHVQWHNDYDIFCRYCCTCPQILRQRKSWVCQSYKRRRRRDGFSQLLNVATLIWACSLDTVYIARNRSIKVLLMLSSQYLRVAKEALLDSGATENFIHPQLVKELQLVKRKLLKPCKIQNVDGTFNKLGDITHTVHINVKR